MSTSGKQGWCKKSTLTRDEIDEIARLMAVCNEQDALDMPLSLESLHKRPGTESDDFLYYEQGTLAGYLYVDSWGQAEKEMTGMVAPEFRRRGIFRQLFAAARAECKAHGVEMVLLICEQGSQTGQAFVRAVGAQYDFSEHKMVLTDFVERRRSDPQFQMRPATQEDRETLISIIATDMGDEDDARQFVDSVFALGQQPQYLATLAGKPLGTLRLDYHDGAAGIYGFVVQPEYRGRGYGRQMLEQIIRQLYTEGVQTITLEVAIEQHTAIGLYTSCGFQVVTTYDYFTHKS
ncbi:MAG TPA: GNAT family N-acetyltransferase [Ktedonobacteraceae bacterium]|jgi:ribosomal protein S18 acetylase RimI-like enzyme